MTSHESWRRSGCSSTRPATGRVETAVSGSEALWRRPVRRHRHRHAHAARMDGARSCPCALYPSMTHRALGQTEQEHAFRALGTAHQFLSKPCSPKMLTGRGERVLPPRAHAQSSRRRARVRRPAGCRRCRASTTRSSSSSARRPALYATRPISSPRTLASPRRCFAS